MASVIIPWGHASAMKRWSAKSFAQTLHRRTFAKNLYGDPQPLAEALDAGTRGKTSTGMPFVLFSDLSKGMGDTISIDMVNSVTQKPVMGDQYLAGRRAQISLANMEMKINQASFGLDAGGRMSQQRTQHDLREITRLTGVGNSGRYIDQMSLVQLAGARGDQDRADWVIPLESDPEFDDIIINPLQAPSYNRYSCAGQKDNIEDLTESDFLRLGDISALRALEDESDFPMQGIELSGDDAVDGTPLGLLLVSPRVWYHLKTYAERYSKDWQTAVAEAGARGANNPLFRGERILWDNILVKKMPRSIRFHQGSTVKGCTSAAAYTTEDRTVPTFGTDVTAGDHAVDRCLYLGAQALAWAFGKDSDSELHFRWWEGLENDGKQKVCSLSAVMGAKKFAFKDANGVHTDLGVRVIDCYAPDPRVKRFS